MFLRWLDKTLRTTRQTGEPTCPHTQGPIRVITPVIIEKKKTVWRCGPSFRLCCEKNPLARASFWYEAHCRLDDLEEGALEIDDDLAEFLLVNAPELELLLAERIRQPTDRQMDQYLAWREKLGIERRRCRPRLPYRDLALLDLKWPVSDDELRKALVSITLQYHPDRTGSEETTAEFIRRKQALDRIQKCMEKKDNK